MFHVESSMEDSPNLETTSTETNMKTPTLIRAYCRKSTNKQETSIEVQRDRIIKYCLYKGWHIDQWLIDEAVCGAMPLEERPAGSKIFDGDTLRVIIFNLDRGFRNLADASITAARFNKMKIGLHILDMQGGEQVDTESANGKLFFSIMAMFAQYFRDKVKENTALGLQKRKENKMTYTRISPFGYKNTGKGNMMLVMPDEQHVIEQVVAKAAQKLSLRRIALAVPNNPRTGKPLSPQMVSNILKEHRGKEAKVA